MLTAYLRRMVACIALASTTQACSSDPSPTVAEVAMREWDRHAGARFQWPHGLPPANGAEVVSGAPNGSGAFVASDMTLATIAESYRKQLEEAGWQVEGGQRNGFYVLYARTAPDSRSIVAIAISPSKQQAADFLLSIVEFMPGDSQP